MGSVCQRLLELHPRWLRVGFRISLGMDAVSFRPLAICEWIWLALAATVSRELDDLALLPTGDQCASRIPSACATGNPGQGWRYCWERHSSNRDQWPGSNSDFHPARTC